MSVFSAGNSGPQQTTTTTNVTTNVSGQGKIQKGGSQNVDSGAIGVNRGSSYIEQGGKQQKLKGNKNKLVEGDAYEGDVTINQGVDTGTLSDLLSQQTDSYSALAQANNNALSDAIRAQSGSASAATSNLSDIIGSAVSKISDLGQTQQTGGVSELNKTFLWVAAILAGLLALFFLGKK